jgi:glycosyltransferase involved in cell wall biosynthesis
MACGLPVVASRIGVNAHIVKDGDNGFHASTEQEWAEALAKLLEDADLRRRLGASGRAQAVDRFSLQSQEARLVSLLQSLC